MLLKMLLSMLLQLLLMLLRFEVPMLGLEGEGKHETVAIVLELLGNASAS